MPANTSRKIHTLSIPEHAVYPNYTETKNQARNKETKMEKYTPHFYAFLQAEKRITTIEKDLVDINITIKIQFSVLVSPAACKLPFQNSGLTTSCGIKISN